MDPSTITLILVALLCPPVVVAVVLVIHALRLRALLTIPARPQLVPTPAQQVPPDLAEFVTQVVPALNELGFRVAASVHAPKMMTVATWTQLLFIRGDRGDRASILLLRPVNSTAIVVVAPFHPMLAFATELVDGRSVRTVMDIDGPAELTPSSSASPTTLAPMRGRVTATYVRHRASVEQTFGRAAVGVVPEPGQEVCWLQGQASLIAANIAASVAFPRDASGTSYRPTWHMAFRSAWKVMWAGRRRQRRPGFEVVPAPCDPHVQ